MTWHLDFFVGCFPSLSMYARAFDFFWRLKAVPLQNRMASMISTGWSGLTNLCIAEILPPCGRQHS